MTLTYPAIQIQTCRVTMETAEAAAGKIWEKQGSRCSPTGRYVFFVLFFINYTVLMTIYFTRLCLQWENNAPNHHHNNEYEAKQPPPHPNIPRHLDASHYPMTRRVTTETAEAAVGMK